MNSKDKDKNSILLQTISVEEPSFGVVKALIEAGGDPTLTNSKGEVVLVEAVKKEKINLPLVRLLLDHSQVDAGKEVEVHGVSFTETALSVAVRSGKADLVRLLLEAGGSYTTPVFDDDYKPGRRVLLPLGLAVKLKSAPILSLLLEHGASECELKEAAILKTKEESLDECLDLAVAGRDPEIIRTLSDFKAKSKLFKAEL